MATVSEVTELNYQTALLPILEDYCTVFNRRDGVNSRIIIDAAKTRYLIINEGWRGSKRIHALVFDAEIRDGKLWLHHDGLDHGIADELTAAGIPKEQIVLGFHPPQVRAETGYGI